jgi:nanoRNase/pAp phosphatase (c-di-AMP/oligoRNAs hydrolase)
MPKTLEQDPSLEPSILFMYDESLRLRLVRGVGWVAAVIIDRQTTEARGEEREGIVASIAAVDSALVGVRVGRGERGFSGAAVEGSGVHAAVGSVLRTHRGVRAGSANAGGKSIRAGRPTVLLSRVSTGCVRSGAKVAGTGGSAH